jgi:hypothetical protein
MEVVESNVRWLHNLADEILVPAREYIGLPSTTAIFRPTGKS